MLKITRVQLLGALSWSFIGGVTSAVVLLLTNILAGRLLGPTEYGKFNFLAAVSQLILVMILFGMDRASLRFVSQSNDVSTQSRHVTAPLYAVMFIGIIFSLVYTLLHRPLAALLGVPPLLLMLALLYALFSSFRQLFDGFIRGLHAFKFQSISRVLESLLILVVFGFLFYGTLYGSAQATYPLYAFSLISGYALYIALCILKLKSYFVPFDRQIFKIQFSFAKIYFLAAVLGTLFGSLDKLVIGKAMTFYDLGIYGAYYAASLNFTAQLSTILGNIFSPMFSKNLHQSSAILKRVDLFTLVLFFPILLLTIGVTTVIIILLGSAYPLTLAYIISFSLLGVLNMIFSLNALMVSVYSKKGIATNLLMGNGLNFLFVGLFLGLIYTFGLSIQLVVTVLIVHNFTQMLLCKYVLYREGAYRP